MKKLKLLTLATITVFLIGCSSEQSESSTGLVLPEANYQTYAGDEFQIQIPRNWDVLTKDKISVEFQESLEVAFRSNFKDLFFTPVITVEKVATTEVSNELFAESVIKRNENNLIDYILVDKQTLSTSIGGSPIFTLVSKFRGKEKIVDDLLEYIQVYLVNDGVGYIVTAAYDFTDNKADSNLMYNSLRTFRLK